MLSFLRRDMRLKTFSSHILLFLLFQSLHLFLIFPPSHWLSTQNDYNLPSPAVIGHEDFRLIFKQVRALPSVRHRAEPLRTVAKVTLSLWLLFLRCASLSRSAWHRCSSNSRWFQVFITDTSFDKDLLLLMKISLIISFINHAFNYPIKHFHLERHNYDHQSAFI